MMERHQAGQEDKLVEIKVDPPSAASPPACCRFSHARALGSATAVMALGLVLLGLTLYFFMLTPSCQQDHAGGGYITRTLTGVESDDMGGHEVFTAETAGVYLIYVWLSLTNVTKEDVILKNTLNGESSELETKKALAEVFFFQNVTLVDNSRISIYFIATCSDSLVHIHKA